ncbi:MAG: hypothetical protein LBI28_07580 [Treponema sp.]|jgi:hypothetical protein|nr:hypothetical protein [Treponema sp.]
MEYGITETEKKGDGYYFVNWSPLAKADRHDIITKVPSVAGVFEIYWMDEKNRLRLFVVGCTNYGGLRSEIRRITDPELCKNDEKAKKILEEKEIWYRYSPTDSANVMSDVIWFFMQQYFPEKESSSHSGRYENIFLKESAPDKLTWVP